MPIISWAIAISAYVFSRPACWLLLAVTRPTTPFLAFSMHTFMAYLATTWPKFQPPSITAVEGVSSTILTSAPGFTAPILMPLA